MTQTTEQAEKKPRRANGEGSTFFWPGRGWYAAVTGADGRRIMRKAPKQTERGAEAYLRKLLADRERGALTRRSVTLEQFLEEWLLDGKRRNLRPTTLESYREKITRHVLPTLGKKRLDKLTVADLDRLYDAKAEAGLSPSSIEMVHVRLHNLLKLAKRRQLVGQVVTELVSRPKVDTYDARTLTVAEAQQLLKGLAGRRHSALWIFLLGTGCRYSEATGLRWQDVDLDRGIARFRQKAARVRQGKKMVITIQATTKTDATRREAPLPKWVSAALRDQSSRVERLRAVSGRRWVEHGLVFPSVNGGPLDESHVNRAWHAMLEELGLEGKGQPPLRMHDLRHTKGTLMADEGEELVVVQRTLGHAKSSITADLYVGKVPKALRQAADRYGELLAPADEPESAVPEAVS